MAIAEGFVGDHEGGGIFVADLNDPGQGNLWPPSGVTIRSNTQIIVMPYRNAAIHRDGRTTPLGNLGAHSAGKSRSFPNRAEVVVEEGVSSQTVRLLVLY